MSVVDSEIERIFPVVQNRGVVLASLRLSNRTKDICLKAGGLRSEVGAGEKEVTSWSCGFSSWLVIPQGPLHLNTQFWREWLCDLSIDFWHLTFKKIPIGFPNPPPPHPLPSVFSSLLWIFFKFPEKLLVFVTTPFPASPKWACRRVYTGLHSVSVRWCVEGDQSDPPIPCRVRKFTSWGSGAREPGRAQVCPPSGTGEN